MVWVPLSEDLALYTICRRKVTFKKPYLKCNTYILGHTKNTHVGFKPSLNEDPTLNAIPAFWVTRKIRMWGLSLL
jgi:hypothetical protein